MLEVGIDTWIQDQLGPGEISPRDYFGVFMGRIEQIPIQQRIVNTYARLCLDFDRFIEVCCDALSVPLTPELREQLEVERTEKLTDNTKWIGNQWAGSDTAPGRYKRELKPETIDYLGRKYAGVLRRMALHDPDYADLYLENVPTG